MQENNWLSRTNGTVSVATCMTISGRLSTMLLYVNMLVKLNGISNTRILWVALLGTELGPNEGKIWSATER